MRLPIPNREPRFLSPQRKRGSATPCLSLAFGAIELDRVQYSLAADRDIATDHSRGVCGSPAHDNKRCRQDAWTRVEHWKIPRRNDGTSRKEGHRSHGPFFSLPLCIVASLLAGSRRM